MDVGCDFIFAGIEPGFRVHSSYMPEFGCGENIQLWICTGVWACKLFDVCRILEGHWHLHRFYPRERQSCYLVQTLIRGSPYDTHHPH